MQLWIEYNGTGGGISQGHGHAVNNVHCDPTANAGWLSQLVGLL
jgi:hypothetical protein